MKSHLQYYELIQEIKRLRARISALEQNRTGYSITGVIHIGVADEPPTAGPSTGGAYLYVVENGSLKYMGPQNVETHVAPA